MPHPSIAAIHQESLEVGHEVLEHVIREGIIKLDTLENITAARYLARSGLLLIEEDHPTGATVEVTLAGLMVYEFRCRLIRLETAAKI